MLLRPPGAADDQDPTGARRADRAGTLTPLPVLIAVLLALLVVALPAAALLTEPLARAAPETTVAGTVTARFFFDQHCLDCQQALPFVQALESRYPDVVFEYHDISLDPADRDLLFALAEQYRLSSIGVPTLVVGSTFCRDWEEIEQRSDAVLTAAVAASAGNQTAPTPRPSPAPFAVTLLGALGVGTALACARRTRR